MNDVTISLLVPVYNGGEYWRECAVSIEKYSCFFDNVIVSINKGDSFLEDLEVAEGLKISNIDIEVQDELLGPIEHFMKVIKTVKTDYIFILAHDDLLLPGVEGMRQNIIKNGNRTDIAYLGTFVFFKESKDIAFVREIYGGSFDKVEFIEYDLAKNFNLNISGMCLPVRSILENSDYFYRFGSGIRFDYVLLTNNKISKIYQLNEATVKIRRHDNQAGKTAGENVRIAGEISYYAYHIIETNDLILRSKLIDKLSIVLFSSLTRGSAYGLFFYFKRLVFFGEKMGFFQLFILNIKIIKVLTGKIFRKILKVVFK
ncbi:glycosyltransferase family A protein [Marinomonas flavescens]|uniref:glycosyltransferase family A protein n=1 Tax=Marinomonas flavescens TaxID=2529379 RepID=UPI0010553FE7|nr:glycosyltransferase family A protein [Marinomonas flavescens]